MRRRRTLLLGVLAIALLLGPAPGARSQQAPVREITKIAGEVYRFRNANHYSVFAVTPAGVIATDPINADAARWLKAEIAQRFKQPVRYLVYSHDHADHISGGDVFADTATVVAHENAKATIIGDEAAHHAAEVRRLGAEGVVPAEHRGDVPARAGQPARQLTPPAARARGTPGT